MDGRYPLSLQQDLEKDRQCCCCSVASLCQLHGLPPHGLQHARFLCPSPSPRVCPIHVRWISDAIQPSHRLSSPSPPACNLAQHQSFPMSQFFASGGQRIGASAAASVFPMSIQEWFPLRLTGLICLLSKGLSRVFSSTTVWKHQFFSAQLSLWSNSYMCILLLESLNILEINLLSVASFANIVPHSVGCLLSCLWYPVLYKSF